MLSSTSNVARTTPWGLGCWPRLLMPLFSIATNWRSTMSLVLPARPSVAVDISTPPSGQNGRARRKKSRDRRPHLRQNVRPAAGDVGRAAVRTAPAEVGRHRHELPRNGELEDLQDLALGRHHGPPAIAQGRLLRKDGHRIHIALLVHLDGIEIAWHRSVQHICAVDGLGIWPDAAWAIELPVQQRAPEGERHVEAIAGRRECNAVRAIEREDLLTDVRSV